MKNEKLTMELQQKLNKILEFIEHYTDSLFKQTGTMIEHYYEAQIIENIAKDTYGAFNDYIISEISQVDRSELIAYIKTYYIREYMQDTAELIILSIIANYRLRIYSDLRFFTFIYKQIITVNHICGVLYAKELLLHNIDIKALRYEYPEYPILNLTNAAKNVAKGGFLQFL